jgi:hypothetical protein
LARVGIEVEVIYDWKQAGKDQKGSEYCKSTKPPQFVALPGTFFGLPAEFFGQWEVLVDTGELV